MRVVALKNVFVWLAGQLGASLQEYVTRDLRDARVPAPAAPAARLLPAHEDRPDHLARAHRHRADEGAHHRARDADAAERRRRSSARSSSCSATRCGSPSRAGRSRRCSRSRCSPCCGSCGRATAACAATTARSRASSRKSVSGVRLVKSFGGERVRGRALRATASHRYSRAWCAITRIACALAADHGD